LTTEHETNPRFDAPFLETTSDVDVSAKCDVSDVRVLRRELLELRGDVVCTVWENRRRMMGNITEKLGVI
jgi:hypothetical protein